MLEYSKREIRNWSILGSCGAFGVAMKEVAKQHENLAVLTADLCFYSGLQDFSKEYAEMLYNVGIAEQNMVGIAAGMAKEGFLPFATTYGTFASTRCCDQVRVNMGYMQMPIKLVGVTAGLTAGILGATHISCEDISIMRSIPNITILSPADSTETVKATIAAADFEGPVYLRLTGAMGDPVVYHSDYSYEIGKAIELKDGKDISLIATGTIVAVALQVAELFEADGIECQVVDMHTIKPVDKSMVEECMDRRFIVTLEEHSVIGGLGSAVSELVSRHKDTVPVLTLGINDEFKHAGDYKHLLKEYGLETDNIYKKIKERLKEV